MVAARATVRCSGGGASMSHVVEQPYFLKKMPSNPFIGAVHDGKTTSYLQGYSVKPMHWLYRFRYNTLPTGIPTGFYNRNPAGKQVHWLEVSTIEKVRVQLTGEEAFGPTLLCSLVILFTIFHSCRYYLYHPDISFYNFALFTSKPFTVINRSSNKYTINQPTFRFMQRAPEFYATDIMRDLYKLGVAANDPFLVRVKAAGREDELYMTNKDYTRTKPNLRELIKDDKPAPLNALIPM